MPSGDVFMPNERWMVEVSLHTGRSHFYCALGFSGHFLSARAFFWTGQSCLVASVQQHDAIPITHTIRYHYVNPPHLMACHLCSSLHVLLLQQFPNCGGPSIRVPVPVRRGSWWSRLHPLLRHLSCWSKLPTAFVMTQASHTIPCNASSTCHTVGMHAML